MSNNPSSTVEMEQQVGSVWEAPTVSVWEAPTVSVLTLRDAAEASKSVMPPSVPSELPPPLMAKEYPGAEGGGKAGFAGKAGTGQDTNGKDWN